ncbi:hypothetical protein SAMN04488008_10792 [Maribacter orientalis]|uniref:Uncharacterized protein n=1 Tax=Maribacter orientalis TaxID=228957 RepID=A0A1H7UGB6_9FLAO|nr:hypothetical protein SAMN04488008_10792 [Maribacter orientalis]
MFITRGIVNHIKGVKFFKVIVYIFLFKILINNILCFNKIKI